MVMKVFARVNLQKYRISNLLNLKTKTENVVDVKDRKSLANHVQSTAQVSVKPALIASADTKRFFTGTTAQLVKKYQMSQPVKRVNVETQNELATISRTTKTLGVLEEHYLSAASHAMLELGRNPAVLLSQSVKKQQVENRTLTKQDIQETKTMKTQLINTLKGEFIKLGFPEKEAHTQARQAFADGLREVFNARKWETIDTHFQHNGMGYQCTLTPAGQMKRGGYNVFHTPYNDNGVASSSSQQTTHATNLWISSVSVPSEKGTEERLFTGVRHGILSPYSLAKNSDARFVGAQARAMEVVTAALFARPDLLREAEQGKTVSLNLASTSLVTGGIGAEKEMMDDQMRAWSVLGSQQPVLVPLRDEQGNIFHASVNLRVAAFNFGVNEFALKGNKGWKQADGYNVEALKTLLGDDLSVTALPKGWVGAYLSQHPRAKNAQKVRTLSQQLKAIWAKKTHHRDGGEPYKAALRVSLLAHEIGAMPCWNCKSGKDRTGMLDAEIKREIVKMHQHEIGLFKQTSGVSIPGSLLSSNEQTLLQTILRHGGNKEVQEYNTGVPGNKVARPMPKFVQLSTWQRIGDANAFKDIRGLSGLV